MPKTLPKPDEHGNYVVSPETTIYPSKRVKGDAVSNLGTYYIRQNGEFVVEGTGLKLFGSVIEALVFLRKQSP